MCDRKMGIIRLVEGWAETSVGAEFPKLTQANACCLRRHASHELKRYVAILNRLRYEDTVILVQRSPGS